MGEDSFLLNYEGTAVLGETINYQTDYAQTSEPRHVLIDIKPGSFPNAVNPKNRGVVPVAILSTDIFSAAIVDAETVRFGSNGVTAIPTHFALEDVDGDGDIDMIFHFRTQETGILSGDTSCRLSGFTVDGQVIKGSDSITTVR